MEYRAKECWSEPLAISVVLGKREKNLKQIGPQNLNLLNLIGGQIGRFVLLCILYV